MKFEACVSSPNILKYFRVFLILIAIDIIYLYRIRDRFENFFIQT